MSFCVNYSNNNNLIKTSSCSGYNLLYIPSVHKIRKDVVSFSSDRESKKYPVYSEEEKKEIFLKKNLSRPMIFHLKNLDDREFFQALTLIDKGFFNSPKQPVAFNLEKFSKLDEENFNKSVKLLDKYKKNGVDLSLYTNVDLAQIVQAEKDDYKKIIKILDLFTSETKPEIFIGNYIKISDIPKKCVNNKQFDDMFSVLEKCIKSNSKLPSMQIIEKVTSPDNNKTERLLNLIEKCLKEKSNVYTSNDSMFHYVFDLEEQNFNQVLKLTEKVKDVKNAYSLLEVAELDKTGFEQAEVLFQKGIGENDLDIIAEIASLDERCFNNALMLIDRADIPLNNICNISLLEDYQLDRIDELLSIGINSSYIADIAKLDNEKYERVFNRNLSQEYFQGSIAGLTYLDDDVYMEMKTKGLLSRFNKSNEKTDLYDYLTTIQNQYLPIKVAEQMQRVGKFSLEIKQFNGKKSVNELTQKEKQILLKSLVAMNNETFTQKKLIIKLAGTSNFIPENREEYCALLNKLSSSIGIETKPISKKVEQEFYNALSLIEKEDSDFRKFDFNDKNVKFQLLYPRGLFIADIKSEISSLNENEKQLICNHFGFQLKKVENVGTTLCGYPFVPNINDIEDERLRKKAEKIALFIKKFSEQNIVKINSSIEMSKQLTAIVRAFPELLTISGKKQHHTHSYTLDIHSLKVLQEIINNPKYSLLSEEDKITLKISALFHDITKKEGMIDKTHPAESAYDAYYILSKLDMPEDEKYKIYHTIKNHDWLEKYNGHKRVNSEKIPLSEFEKKQVAQKIAFELRKGNAFEMACILTEADMNSVKDDKSFFKRFEPVFNEGIQTIGGYVKEIKESAICLPQNKIPKADEIKIDNINTKINKTILQNGKEVQNTFVYLKKGLDLSQYGFENGLISDDLNILVHGLDSNEQAGIFNTLGQIDSNALLSTSYVNYSQDNYHVFRQNGFILNVDCDDIGAGYYRDFASGIKKDINLIRTKYLFEGRNTDYRTFMSDLIKIEMNISDEEYVELYKKIENKSLIELDKLYPECSKAFRNIIKKMESGKRSYGRAYNEILVLRPKIQAVFNYGNGEIPEFLLEYANDNNVPVICFGE